MNQFKSKRGTSNGYQNIQDLMNESNMQLKVDQILGTFDRPVVKSTKNIN